MLDLAREHEQFAVLKTENAGRNLEYYYLRQAVKGNFRWPRDWPNHIPKLKHNYCKPISERFSTYLMGNSFQFNINRPNTLEFRDQAEKSEKILRRIFELSQGGIQFLTGARTGSVFGRTIYRVYRTGKKGREHACFRHAQPDYFYGILANDGPAGEYAKVFYSYPLDRSEAERLFGKRPYRDEADLSQQYRYDALIEEQRSLGYVSTLRRRIPVLEIWTKDEYCLEVGGEVIFNGDNPMKWDDTEEGFIPFVVIENIRNEGELSGEGDITQIRELNEQMNYLLSRKMYVVGRWLQPTLVWEGAPQNYLEVLTSTIGGGGAIPTRLGSRLYFLAYEHNNPSVVELETTMRQALLETSGLNEIAYQGTVHGYVNTGPSVNAQYQPLKSTILKKQEAWTAGLQQLGAMLLQLQEDIGDSKVLGLTVVNSSVNSKDGQDGEVVTLSGKDIAGLREIDITWPSLLPKDDTAAAQLEIQKSQIGLQSLYTTLEKLGEEFPDDELARIRQENTDPALKGQQVAEQTRANASATTAQANMQNAGPQPGDPNAPAAQPLPVQDSFDSSRGPSNENVLLAQNNIGARLRKLAKSAKPALVDNGQEPVIGPR